MDQRSQAQTQGRQQDFEQIVQRLETLKNRTGGKTELNNEIDQIIQSVRQLGQGMEQESGSTRSPEYSR